MNYIQYLSMYKHTNKRQMEDAILSFSSLLVNHHYD